MITTFTIAPSLNQAEPGAQYFAMLTAQARTAVKGPIQSTLAWNLCEYLDSVDAGDQVMDKALYGRCVAMLGVYLMTNKSKPEVSALKNKSWAANTLMDVLEDTGMNWAEQQKCA